MNVNLYNQLIEQFNFITEPLWELYGSYNGFAGSPLLGTILLGLIASTYPGQITYHLGAMTYLTSQMRFKSNWFIILISLFAGKLASVYLIIGMYLWMGEGWIERIENLGPTFYLLLGISFLNSANRMKHLSFYKSVFKKPLIFQKIKMHPMRNMVK